MIRLIGAKLATILIICVALIWGNCYPVRAADGENPDSVVLFEYTEPFETSWAVNQPALVANPDGRLHLFWGVTPLEDSAIYYMELVDGVWSDPVDILLGPNLQMHNFGASAVMDSRGYLHIIWNNGGLYYSSAQAIEAGDPRAWADPVEIVALANDGRLFVDSNDRLHVVYVSSQDVTTLSYINCESAACSWTAPSIVTLASQGEAVRLPHLWVSAEGVLHATWGQVQLPDGWPPTGVYYARSLDDGATWSQSVQLGGEGQGNPAIIGLEEDELHLVWLATHPGRYHTRSLDGGITWASSQEFTPVYSGMLVGYVDLVLDSAQQIHLFVEGSNIPMHSVWDGRQWSSFESIGRGESAMAAITHGNLLHFVWLNPATMYYASHVIPNAPVIALAELPGVEPPVNSAEISLTTPLLATESPTPSLMFSRTLELPSNRSARSTTPILWGLGSVFLIIGIVFFIYLSRHRLFQR